jgi:hypothetical protein
VATQKITCPLVTGAAPARTDAVNVIGVPVAIEEDERVRVVLVAGCVARACGAGQAAAMASVTAIRRIRGQRGSVPTFWAFRATQWRLNPTEGSHALGSNLQAMCGVVF